MEELIEGLQKLSEWILKFPDELKEKMMESFYKNQWFTVENQELMLKAIAENYLQKEKLEEWVSNYEFKNENPKKIGLVMAGNIPLVGFHDLLCVWMSGNTALVKLSSKDEVMLPLLVSQLEKISPAFIGKTIFADRLNEADAVIATGSNNSARYFEYYFKNKPHIIRAGRSSVAVLNGNETSDDILNLGKDIFRYFGLGCRNVSKLFLPEGFNPTKLFEGLNFYSEIAQHNKYKNNYDYNLTILLMNKTPHFVNEFLILQENNNVASPVAIVYYEFYSSDKDLKEKLSRDEENIQCIVCQTDAVLETASVSFGKSQEPSLVDYADNIDTMKFLKGLN